MGATTDTDDVLTVCPPLNRREQSYIRRLTRSAESRTIRRPGYHCPWEPTCLTRRPRMQGMAGRPR